MALNAPHSNESLKKGRGTMTRPSDFTRGRILKAAESLFAERGYKDTSVRAVVAKARVNQAGSPGPRPRASVITPLWSPGMSADAWVLPNAAAASVQAVVTT